MEALTFGSLAGSVRHCLLTWLDASGISSRDGQGACPSMESFSRPFVCRGQSAELVALVAVDGSDLELRGSLIV